MLKRLVSRSSLAEKPREQPEPVPSLPWHPKFNLSGRGGSGDILSTPASSECAHISDVKTRNRKPSSSSGPRKVRTFGRGGSGNVCARHNNSGNKSSPLPDAAQLEYDYLLAHKASRAYQPQSTGRGGAGNIKTLPRPIGKALQILVTITKLGTPP